MPKEKLEWFVTDKIRNYILTDGHLLELIKQSNEALDRQAPGILTPAAFPFSIWYDDRKDGISSMNGTNRVNIKKGLRVSIVLKTDQRFGKLTEGIVKDILTKSPVHPHGIKVRLEDGQVGRVKEIKV